MVTRLSDIGVVARRDAETAASAAGVDVIELARVEDHAALSRLFDEVWTGVDGSLVHQNLLTALHRGGNYVAGAFAEKRLVGGAVGFLALSPQPLHLHSHMTGVVPGGQSRGVGRALKLHQRAWCIDRGITTISWTYDPLVRLNSYFNLMKLGATIVGYVDNFYGEMSDGLNENEQSDRCVVDWLVKSERVQQALAGRLPDVQPEALLGAGGLVALDEDADGKPIQQEVAGDVVLCKVPQDIVALRKSDPDTAHGWRLAMRATLGAAVRSGYRVRHLSRDGWYVLEKSQH